MMSHDEMIAVIAAHKEGKMIQCKQSWGWTDVPTPMFHFSDFTYRIKPEPRQPRVIWRNEYPGGKGTICRGTYETKEKASRASGDGCIGQVKFVEVIEEDEEA